MLPARNHDLGACLERVDRLRVFPEAATRILEVCQQPDSTLTDLERAVSTDPVLSARILQVANSPLFGGRQVGGLRRAVQLLGLDGTRGVAFALAVSSMGRRGGPRAKDLHEHAMATAAVVRELAGEIPGIHPGLLFATALLHDLGHQLLNLLEPEALDQLLGKLGHDGRVLVQAERMHFGFDHAQLGAVCLRRWGLPESSATLVASHHAPVRKGDGIGHHRSRALLQVADAVGDALVAGAQPDELVDVARWHALTPMLGRSEDVVEQAILRVPVAMGELAA